MMPISRARIAATTACCSDSGSETDGLGVGEVALVEDRLRGGDPQLLGDEGDGEREQGVEVEEAIGRVMAGDGERAGEDRQHERRALADAQEHPEGAAGLAAVPAPGAEQGGERVEEGDGEGAGDDGLGHARVTRGLRPGDELGRIWGSRFRADRHYVTH